MSRAKGSFQEPVVPRLGSGVCICACGVRVSARASERACADTLGALVVLSDFRCSRNETAMG